MVEANTIRGHWDEKMDFDWNQGHRVISSNLGRTAESGNFSLEPSSCWGHRVCNSRLAVGRLRASNISQQRESPSLDQPHLLWVLNHVQ